MAHDHFSIADQEFAEVRSAIDEQGEDLRSEASTLVEDDASVGDDFGELPLDEVPASLSGATAVVDDEDGASPTLSIRRAGVYRHPNHRLRRIPSDPPPIENALGLDLGPPISFHPFDSSIETSADTPTIEPPEPPSPRSVSLRRPSELRYAAPAFMVAPKSLACPPRSRMLSVRRKRPQPGPEEVRTAWEQYSDRWRALLSDTDPNDDHGRPPLNGSRVPWPILNHTSSPITPDDIQDLLLSTVHSTDLSIKKRIREALRLYHPDRFEQLVIQRIENEGERASVRERAGMVVRSLNALLERES